MSIERKYIIILSLIGILLFFYGIGTTDLWGALVARNAQMAREMIQEGNWIVPHVNGHPDYEKPILWIWILAVFCIPFGVNEFTVTFPCALAALGTVYVVYALGRRLGGPTCGFRAALIYMTSVKVMHMARTPRIDMSLTLFITLAYYFFLRGYQESDKRRSSYLFVTVFMALGFLDKGPVGVGLPAGGILIYLLLSRDLRHLKKLITIRNIFTFLVIAAPWYLAVSVKTAGEFPREFFLYRNVTVFAIYSEAQPLWFYIPQLLAGFLPWSVFLPFALMSVFKRERNNLSLLPLVWFLWVFLFFSFVMYKRSDYLLPLYPAAAVLTTIFWSSIEDGSSRWMRVAAKLMVCLLITVVICALVVVVLISLPGFADRVISSEIVQEHSNETDRDMMNVYTGILNRDTWLLIPFFIAAIIFFFYQLRRFGAGGRRVTPLLLGIAAVMIFLHTYFLCAILPEADRTISLRPYSESIMKTIKPNERFALYDFWYYEFGYYMRREVTELETPQELRDYFSEPGPAYCLVRKKNLDEAVGILDGLPYSVDPALGDTRGKFAMIVRAPNRGFKDVRR